ncbi:hypothetical protein ACE6H2_003234 [Prunus campanulata]
MMVVEIAEKRDQGQAPLFGNYLPLTSERNKFMNSRSFPISKSKQATHLTRSYSSLKPFKQAHTDDIAQL